MESSLTRRQVLQAGVAAGAVALGSDPFVKMANAALTPPLGKLSDIEHVIILMKENRSFDHYFGSLRGVRGFDVPTARRGDGGSLFAQADPGHPDGHILPFRSTPSAPAASAPLMWRRIPGTYRWVNDASKAILSSSISFADITSL